MSTARAPFKYSYFQLTFGQEEAYLEPHVTYERLRRCGYDAIEICPPKGRYGMGVAMEDYLATHKKLKADFGLEVSNVNERWGEMWDPYSPDFKTLTEPKTAALAVSETISTIDFAASSSRPPTTSRWASSSTPPPTTSGSSSSPGATTSASSSDRSAADGIACLKLAERVAE